MNNVQIRSDASSRKEHVKQLCEIAEEIYK